MTTERIHVTEEGLATLQKELDHMITVRRPAVIKAIALAREEGDLRENAGYDAARHDQAIIERKILELEDKIRRAVIIEHRDDKSVQIGAKVTIDMEGTERTFTIVGAYEAKPAEQRISNESPIGRALVGHSLGDEVQIVTPAATVNARITAIEYE